MMCPLCLLWSAGCLLLVGRSGARHRSRPCRRRCLRSGHHLPVPCQGTLCAGTLYSSRCFGTGSRIGSLSRDQSLPSFGPCADPSSSSL
uniref:Putative secreted protein n=1 Tax=Ixodes ricinus TaxID=34613 RepID=A0A6B0U032_IXORI